MIIVKVHHEGSQKTLTPDDVLTFGRAATCTLVIGPSDHGISRHAGSITFDGTCWWVANESAKRPLDVIDTATRRSTSLAVVAPDGGRDRYPVLEAVTVVAVGDVRQYAIDVVTERSTEVEGTTDQRSEPSAGHTTQLVRLTPRQLEAVIALAWSYLQPFPRYRAEPASYAEVAQRIGCGPKRAEKLIAQARERMVEAGLPGLVDVRDARSAVCSTALALRLIGSDSCGWLETRMLDHEEGWPAPDQRGPH